MKEEESYKVYVTCLNCGGNVYLYEGFDCKKCKNEVTAAQKAYLNSFIKK